MRRKRASRCRGHNAARLTSAGAERESPGARSAKLAPGSERHLVVSVQLAKGRYWLPTIAVTGVTAALIVADPHDTPYFRRTRIRRLQRCLLGNHYGAEIGIVPQPFWWWDISARFLRGKDRAARRRSLCDSAIVDVVMKVATRRLRPSDIPPYGLSPTFFHSHVSLPA